MIFCGKNLKNPQLKESQKVFDSLADRINDNLDIVNYINLYENFHKLKMVVLNENQNFCLKFLMSRDIEDITNDNYEDNLKNSIDYFKERNRNGTVDNADRMLLSNFNKKFLYFLYD